MSSAFSQRPIEAETAGMIGAPRKISDDMASGSWLAGLNKRGDGLLFSNLPSFNKLAIRYASVIGVLCSATDRELL